MSAAPTPAAPKTNRIGLPKTAYEGGKSTLCLGCGHDVITKQIITAFYEMGVAPHQVAKFSGIGCSSKTPAYFLNRAWGFNGVHGRMPSLATGALMANPRLVGIGVSGDGDTASIGVGQFVHLVRRNVPLLYVIENNGVYGLTKGQFSASSDLGSKSKRGEPNQMRPIDPAMLGLSLGATFIARSFSGDKEQLVPILKAGLRHRGFALVDVISPCVTFNDHEGSTKSYAHTRKKTLQILHADFVPPAEEITASIPEGGEITVRLHDDSEVRFTRVAADYDPRDRARVMKSLHGWQEQGVIPTGLLFVDEGLGDMHEMSKTVDTPLSQVRYEDLCPGSAALEALQAAYR